MIYSSWSHFTALITVITFNYSQKNDASGERLALTLKPESHVKLQHQIKYLAGWGVDVSEQSETSKDQQSRQVRSLLTWRSSCKEQKYISVWIKVLAWPTSTSLTHTHTIWNHRPVKTIISSALFNQWILYQRQRAVPSTSHILCADHFIIHYEYAWHTVYSRILMRHAPYLWKHSMKLLGLISTALYHPAL